MTLKELAKQIGCSRATLDRVINNREGVGEKRRREILDSIERLGYKPNVTGKILSKQSRTLIGIIVGLDMTPSDSRVFTVILEGMMECCNELEQSGIKFLFKYMKTGCVKEQIELIHELVSEGAVGIALSFREDADNLYDVIRKYTLKGIKFLPYFAAKSETDTRITFEYQLGTDQRREGYMAAGLLGKYLRNSGKVALISGLEENAVHQIRVNSAKELLEREYPGITVLPIYKNVFPKENVVPVCDEIFREHPDVSGIVASCGFSGDITKYLEEKGKKDQVFVVLYDFTNIAIRDLKEGRCDVVIGINLKRLGYKSIMAIYDLVFKGEVNDDTLYAPLEILVKETIIPLP